MKHLSVKWSMTSLRRCALVLAGLFSVAPHALADAGENFSLLALLTPNLPPAVVPAPTQAEDSLAVYELREAPRFAAPIDLTVPPQDLLTRLRNGFSMTNLNNDLVLHYQQWYQNRPDQLRRMVERSRPFLHYILEEIERRGMPTELALLPMVESSFNPLAYSRAHASGLWQFIPATGKRYNLEQSWWQDQRRDIVASTGAALDYLQTIYDMHGDWHLALASYNWGEGAVKRAVEKNSARGLATDYNSLAMPNETRHYVPKLQALKNIFGNPALVAELRIPELINRPYFATIETPRPMDIKTAARLAEMPLQEFLALNPAHNRPVIKPDTPLVLPAEKLDRFQSNLENHDEPLTEWEAYTLKAGERLEKIAPRFGIALDDLKRVNGIQGRIRVAAGSTLLVPAGRGATDLADLDAPPRLSVMNEPEPPVRPALRTTGKAAGKGSVSAKASKSTPTKTLAKLPGKAKTASASTAHRPTTTIAPSKGTKVAKATPSRRG